MLRFAVPALILVACGQPAPTAATAPADDGTAAGRVTEGSATAMGMLAFLNDADTSLALLDDDVGLDSRAANSIIDWRNGPDQLAGTGDEREYSTVAQVDARYYVGNSALGRIEAWAETHDWVPTEPTDHLGTWDDVDFTVAEAAAVVELANTTGANTLDDDWALDARAVDSIVDARPIENVHELAGLYYVGTSALTTLKEQAEGEVGCDTPGWDIEYIYDEGDDAWRDSVPAGLEAAIDDVLLTDDWCGEATGEPWFVKATIDRYECVDKGYTIELGQGMLEYPEISWYIEFEVDVDFGFDYAVCEV